MPQVTVGFFADSLEKLEAFRQQEIESLADIWCIENNYRGAGRACQFLEDPVKSRVALIEFDSDAVCKAVSGRSMLLHSVFAYLTMAKSVRVFLQKLRALHEQLERIGMGKGHRFKLHIEACGFSFTQEEKRHLYEILGSALPEEGIIDLSTPESEFWVFFEGRRSVLAESEAKGGGISIDRICFTKFLHHSARRSINDKYSLKRRPHIGTTSLPPELAFMVANIARIRAHAVVYDCFCGTGSTLTTAAHFGAVSFGSDRDGRTMRERHTQKPKSNAKKLPKPRAVDLQMQGAKSIFTNMAFYGHKGIFADVLRVSAESCRNLWRYSGGLFDAIVTDPPYGIREGVKKVDRSRCLQMQMDRLAMKEEASKNQQEEKVLLSSIPFEQYSTEELEADLLAFAAKFLRPNGRLVFWHPTAAGVPDSLPTHPILKLKYRATQYVNSRFARDLLVYEREIEEKLSVKEPLIGNEQCNEWIKNVVEADRNSIFVEGSDKSRVRDAYFKLE